MSNDTTTQILLDICELIQTKLDGVVTHESMSRYNVDSSAELVQEMKRLLEGRIK